MRQVGYKHEQPIYYWKLNNDGTLTKSVITVYKEHNYYREIHYQFMMGGSIHSIRSTQMSRFVNNRVCLFEDDEAKAVKIIEDVLEARASKYKYDYENASKLLELVRDNN